MASFDDWLSVTDPRLFGEALAEQFRLSRKELDKAMQALAPAFAIGLQSALADPQSWQDLSKAFGGLVPGFNGAASGGKEPGEIFTRTFFGSDALASAIARQASLVAGIAPDVLQKLMPGLAALAMQAMVRSSMENLTRNAPAGLATGDLGGATAEMMRRGANAVEALSRPSDSTRRSASFPHPMAEQMSGLGDVFANSLKASLSWMQVPEPSGRTKADASKASPPIDPMAPFAAMFKAFADGMSGAARGESRPAPSPTPPPPAPAPASKGDGLVGDMMRSGQSLGDGYAREMAALFERYGRPAKSS